MRDDLIKAGARQDALLNYKDYARQRISDNLPAAELERRDRADGVHLLPALAQRNADGSFTLVALPREAQVAPVYGMLVDDVDGNGTSDLCGPQLRRVKPEIGRMSAGYGFCCWAMARARSHRFARWRAVFSYQTGARDRADRAPAALVKW